MGARSAFTPVEARGGSSTPIKPGTAGRRRQSKLKRQVSSGLQQMVLPAVLDDTVQEVDEEAATLETMPDHLSEASSKDGSNNSQAQLFDFIGATCSASAWFTSCFPCAVVDINDGDDYVMDKLTRESAMNAMYSEKPALPGNNSLESKGSAQAEKNDVMYVHVPEQEKNDAPAQSMPPLIQEDDEEEMDEISLHDEDDDVPTPGSSNSSGIVDHQQAALPPKASKTPFQSPKGALKKKFSVKKVFGKSKKKVHTDV